MSEKIDNLILEHLKTFQAGQNRIESELKEIKHRVSNLEIGVAAVRRDVAHFATEHATQYISIDRINERIERIEKRLELS